MSEIYRDATEGATAKRQDLLRRRRDELATMPHAIRRVVVARAARASAGLGLAIGGGALLTLALSPWLVDAVDHVLPGIRPAGAATVLAATWLLALTAYMISLARSQHRFAVAMSHYVLPGADLDHDLQRLDHEHPDEIARGMAHRREVASATWPVLGAALAVPPILLYIAHAIAERGWPVMTTFERALGSHGTLFSAYGVAGVVGALAMTRRPTRSPAAFNALVAIALAFVAAAVAVRSRALAPFAVVPLTMALVVRRLRIERAAISAHDPAAGSELFSFRVVARAVWAKARVLGRTAGAPATLRTAIVLALVLGGWHYTHRPTPAPDIALPPTLADVTRLTTPSFSSAADNDPQPHPASLDHGALRFDFELDGKAITVKKLADLAEVPPGWMVTIDLRVEVTVGAGGTTSLIAVTPFGDEPVEIDGLHRFERSACNGHSVELGLTVAPVHPGPEHATVYVVPTLSPASCPARQ